MKLLFFFNLQILALHFGAFIEDSIGWLIAHEAVAIDRIVGQGATLAKVVPTSRHYRTAKDLLTNSAY